MRNKHFLLLLSIAFCAALALGFSSYLAFMYQRAYSEADGQWSRAKMALTRNFMLYGELVSSDAQKQLLVISTLDPYRGTGTTQYKLGLVPGAFVGWQETRTTDNNLTTISSTTPLSPEAFWALPPGTKMKFLIVPQGEGTAIGFLLAGNPF